MKKPRASLKINFKFQKKNTTNRNESSQRNASTNLNLTGLEINPNIKTLRVSLVDIGEIIDLSKKSFSFNLFNQQMMEKTKKTGTTKGFYNFR